MLKLGKIQFLKNISARGSLFMVGETDFPASEKHFFLHFQIILSVFFRLVEEYFSTKSFIPAGGNGFSN